MSSFWYTPKLNSMWSYWVTKSLLTKRMASMMLFTISEFVKPALWNFYDSFSVIKSSAYRKVWVSWYSFQNKWLWFYLGRNDEPQQLCLSYGLVSFMKLSAMVEAQMMLKIFVVASSGFQALLNSTIQKVHYVQVLCACSIEVSEYTHVGELCRLIVLLNALVFVY